MMCQRCQNEATVHLTEPGKGQRREFHLCPACARKAGLSLPESPPILPLDAVVQSLIIANVGELVGELAEMACPDCGIKFMEFRAGGRLGCPQDYSVFSKGLTDALAAVPRRHPPRGQDSAAARGGLGTAPAAHRGCARPSAVKTMRKPRGCETCCARGTHAHDS